jgi:hypothetical protein
MLQPLKVAELTTNPPPVLISPLSVEEAQVIEARDELITTFDETPVQVPPVQAEAGDARTTVEVTAATAAKARREVLGMDSSFRSGRAEATRG